MSAEPIVVMLRERYFWNILIIKVEGVNQHEPGELYSKLYSFFTFTGSHKYIPLYVEMMSFVKYCLSFYSLK